MTETESRRGNDAPLPAARLHAASPPLWASLVATVAGVGRLRPGPGTWGSAAAILVWYPLARSLAPGNRTPLAILLAAGAIAAGIPAATLVARVSGIEDPQFVVIDEVAGQLIALIGASLSWKSLLVGFILFRGLDMVKPPPARQLERLPGGYGIVMDDVAAGLYALVIMQLLQHFDILQH